MAASATPAAPAEVEARVTGFTTEDGIKYSVVDGGVSVQDYTGDASELVIPASVT